MKRVYKLLQALLVCSIFIFTSCVTTYSASQKFYETLSQQSGISLSKEGSTIVITPETFSSALIFYPGAFVEYESYLPQMMQVAQNGIQVFVVKMPGKMAILNPNAASSITKNHPEIEKWFIAGHSMGGAMAESHVAKNSQKYQGLILLAAYGTKDISKTSLRVLSIYGSNDGVLNHENYEKNRANLPLYIEEIIIEGGNHGQFGNYGFQKGDHEALVTREEQQKITAQAIAAFINN